MKRGGIHKHPAQRHSQSHSKVPPGEKQFQQSHSQARPHHEPCLLGLSAAPIPKRSTTTFLYSVTSLVGPWHHSDQALHHPLEGLSTESWEPPFSLFRMHVVFLTRQWKQRLPILRMHTSRAGLQNESITDNHFLQITATYSFSLHRYSLFLHKLFWYYSILQSIIHKDV